MSPIGLITKILRPVTVISETLDIVLELSNTAHKKERRKACLFILTLIQLLAVLM